MVSHAALSVSVLFDEGHIRDYLDDTNADSLLRAAVEWHSAFRLPDSLDERTQRLCQILRDADKIDILRVNVETPMEEIYNVTTACKSCKPCLRCHCCRADSSSFSICCRTSAMTRSFLRWNTTTCWRRPCRFTSRP